MITIKGENVVIKGANTGKFPVYLDPDLVRGMILVPYGWSMNVAPSDTDATVSSNLTTALSGLLINNVYSARGFHIGAFEGFDDKSEAPTEQTLGYGKKVDTFRGVYHWHFSYDNGGFQYHQAVMSFKGKTGLYKALFYDAKGTVYGTIAQDASGNTTGIQGIRLSRFYPNDWKLAEKSKEAEYGLDVSLHDAAEINESMFAVQTNTDIQTFVDALGIQDVVITGTTSGTAGLAPLTILTGNGAINLALSLPGMMTTALILATNHNTGSAITVTSVTILNGVVNVQLDTTDTDYDIGVKADIKLASVSALSGAGYKYYESNVYQYTMT